jgi:6-phosphogluconolactonase
MPELIVDDDPAAAAFRLVREAAPRTVALAGGSTPRGLYERLATGSPGRSWEEVTVLLTDERCVPEAHPDSNLGMVEAALLSRLPSPGPRVVAARGGACDADTLHREVAQVLEGRDPALDLAVLGLGVDGHTASLFPGDPALAERTRWVLRVERPDHPRLTLTLRALTSVGTALFLVSGAGKRDAVRDLLEGEDLPATRVRAGRVVVVADPAAAGASG